ncbi:unnamed protein product [Prunus armeniaca]
MAADRGGEGLGLEEGSFVVHLALVLPESGVGAERNQLRKSARSPPNPEDSGFIKIEVRDIYGYATELLLLVTPSLQLRFESTTCLRTRFVALYATVQLKSSNSFPIKKSTFKLIKYSRGLGYYMYDHSYKKE